MLLQQAPVEYVQDEDDAEYAYDPTDTNEDDMNNSLPDEEGAVPPTPKWHACRFAAKKGGIYDLRPLSRNKKLVEAAAKFSSLRSMYGSSMDYAEADWIHMDDTIANTTYFLNICSDVILVPPACKVLQKMDPSPAFQVTAAGQCFYLGTLKTFQWKPIDSTVPGKGLELYYENGERCGWGKTRKIKFVFTCSKYYTLEDGPMVVFEHPGGCEYEVQWPSMVGCPHTGMLSQLGLQDQSGTTTSGGKVLMGIAIGAAVLGGAAYFYLNRRKNSDYTNL